MAIKTKTIVIKVNDKYFLQSPSPKVTIGSNFFSLSNISRIYGLYVLPNNPVINPTGSVPIFNNLITSLVGLPNSPKLVSLFERIDATFVVDLMFKAKLRTGFVSENLLNYYYFDVKINSSAALMIMVDKMKSLPGIDFVYVRGELSNTETSTKRPLVGLTDTFEAIQGEAVEVNNLLTPIENLPEATQSLEKKPEILPVVNIKLANEMAKFEGVKSDENIDQSKSTIPINPQTPKSIPTTVIPINDKIKSLFNYCKLSSENIESGKNITVIDFERGWNFVQNDNSLYLNLASSAVQGGGYNHASHKLHGQKTLNILFGKQTLSNQIDGLCKGAKAKIASTWFGPSLSDKQPEPALVKTLVNSGIIEGDIVLIEVQIDRWSINNLPIEIESAIYAVIKVGVQAGYIIIEAAANGGHPLDTITSAIHTTSQTTSIMTTENPPVNIGRNSLGTGAVVVGGRKANLLIDNALNYGDRVDYYCFAESSLTASNIPFNLTSLASAVTAALVARFQSQAMNSIATGGINRRLTISEIKTLLSSIPYPDSPSTLPVPTSFKQFLTNNHIPTLSTVSILNP